MPQCVRSHYLQIKIKIMGNLSSSSTTSELPTSMRRWVLVQVNDDVTKAVLKVEEVPLPVPASGQVLIRVVAAPVNPSDYAIWQRSRPVQGDPEPQGNEGSGVVVQSGGGVYANSLVGKNVGFVCNVKGSNSYAEYCVVDPMTGCYPLPESVPVADAASHFVNPYTAYGFVDTVRSRHVASSSSPRPGFIHTAACSQLGQMLVKLCLKEEITLINVVRRKSQAETLRSLGAEHIVNSSEEGWETTLKSKIKELGIQFAFDAVAGEMTGKLLSMLPRKGTCFVYGRLSNEPCSNVQPLDLIYRRKKIEGFFLSSWMKKGGIASMYLRSKRATAAVHEGLAPAATGSGAGWSRTNFEDCSLDGMWDSFLDLCAHGFTGRKLRIVMAKQ